MMHRQMGSMSCVRLANRRRFENINFSSLLFHQLHPLYMTAFTSLSIAVKQLQLHLVHVFISLFLFILLTASKATAITPIYLFFFTIHCHLIHVHIYINSQIVPPEKVSVGQEGQPGPTIAQSQLGNAPWASLPKEHLLALNRLLYFRASICSALKLHTRHYGQLTLSHVSKSLAGLSLFCAQSNLFKNAIKSHFFSTHIFQLS